MATGIAWANAVPDAKTPMLRADRDFGNRPSRMILAFSSTGAFYGARTIGDLRTNGAVLGLLRVVSSGKAQSCDVEMARFRHVPWITSV